MTYKLFSEYGLPIILTGIGLIPKGKIMSEAIGYFFIFAGITTFFLSRMYYFREEEKREVIAILDLSKKAKSLDDDWVKSEMLKVLLPSENILREINLLSCFEPLSEDFRQKLFSIEEFSNPEFKFIDECLEKKKIELINLCGEIRARFLGYDKNAKQQALDRGNIELSLKFSKRDIENFEVLQEFKKVIREFVQMVK